MWDEESVVFFEMEWVLKCICTDAKQINYAYVRFSFETIRISAIKTSQMQRKLELRSVGHLG